jgi:hypothetical protein
MKFVRAHEEPGGEGHATSRSHQDERKEARDQLTLVLSFFPRVDAKASAILAINTGMLAVLASNAPPLLTLSVFSCISAGIAVAVIAGSLWFLYRVAFPVLHGGHRSLIYFREIARRTEASFIEEFLGQTSPFRFAQSVGIDTGEVRVARAGVRNDNDLIWVGRAPKIAAKLSSIREQGYSTYITEAVFDKLHESAKVFNGQQMWERRSWSKGEPYGTGIV